MFIQGPVTLVISISALFVTGPGHAPSATAHTPSVTTREIKHKPIITGADQTAAYLPLLKGKRVGILGNPSTIIGSRSMVDSLHELGVDIKELFGPEHGFRGKASNGASVFAGRPVTSIATSSTGRPSR